MRDAEEIRHSLEQAAESAVQRIAQLEGWTSAPLREEVYKAGFRAGAVWFAETIQPAIDNLTDALKRPEGEK